MPVRGRGPSVLRVESTRHGRPGERRALTVPWWAWSIVLAAVAMAQQLLDVTGVFAHGSAADIGPVTTTLLVTGVWLAVAVGLRVDQPVITLAFAGLLHGAATLTLDLGPRSFAAIDPGLPQPTGPLAIVATNVAFGALVGLVALVVTRNRRVVAVS